MRKGNGKITVNKKPAEEYFRRETSRMISQQAMAVTGTQGSYDLYITVRGGGESGQAGAVRHGIARALAKLSGEMRILLRAATPDLITRDDRKTERKKVGLRGARCAPQYSKR